MEDQWHNWQKPDEASEMEVATVAQWQGQQLLQSALVAVVAAEPHHADPMRADIPEHTTVT